MRLKALSFLLGLLLASGSLAADLAVTVRASQAIGPISPFIYGVNQPPGERSGATLMRLGGNRMTGCNWETNASNAGNDWKHSSDIWLCTDCYKLSDCDQPGAIFEHFVENAKSLKMDSVITIPMVDYVTGDTNGTVTEQEMAPSKRWVRNAPFLRGRKGKPKFPPNLRDKAVYGDELVQFLISKFGTADKGGVKFYNLDNEPALWKSTHPRIHPNPVRYDELVNKTEQYASMITRLDPSAMVLGPVAYGWQEFRTLQDAPDSAEWKAKYGTFLDFYLDRASGLEKSNGRRLLHVLDVHFYPEAQGNGKRITEGDTSPDSVDARLQAPRSLWDPTYVEKSWITQHSTGGQPIRLIPWLKEKVAKWYPGTKLGITEYDYGAGDKVSGGLAQADVLGVYGREGVYLACLWSDWKPYPGAAFKLYRNYDGKGAAFGDTSVAVDNPDVERLSVYAATDKKQPGKLWVVAINKSQKEFAPLSLSTDGGAYTTFKAYGFGEASPDVKKLGEGQVVSGVLAYKLEPLSAVLLAIE